MTITSVVKKLSMAATGATLMTLGIAVINTPDAQAIQLSFVGSWSVYEPGAPEWTSSPPNGPLAYTAQEAAALLFGGNPTDYYISTIDENPLNINHMAWYDVIGYGAATFAENYNNKYLGLYYGPTNGYDFANINNAASAFVRDNFVSNVNYAFRVVPEPFTMLGVSTAIAFGAVFKRTSKSDDQKD